MSSAIAMMAITGATTATTFAEVGPDGNPYTSDNYVPKEQKNETLESLYNEVKGIFKGENVEKVRFYVKDGSYYTFDLKNPLEEKRKMVKPKADGIIDVIDVINSFS